jgi:hypothetical protein
VIPKALLDSKSFTFVKNKKMSYVYSNGLCDEALRIMNSKDPLDSRLTRAFGEMDVSTYGDTSDEIWNKWQILKRRYYTVTSEIHRLRQEGEVIEDTPDELKKFGEDLLELIHEWQKFNKSEIKQGRRRKNA